MTKQAKVPYKVTSTIKHIEELTLRQVPVDPTKPGGPKQPALRGLLRRVEQVAANPARNVLSLPDGFPSTTPGNGSPGGGKGGRLEVVLDGERVPTTSVEVAAFARVRLDPVEVLADEIERQLRAFDLAVSSLRHALERWDSLRSTAELPDAPQCWVATHHRLPWDEDWAPMVTTRFEGVLEQPWPEERRVCRWVYDFTRKHKRIPSADECRQYLARGIVRVQTGEATS